MSKPLNILFVSSEVEPFAKTGGLADVCSALPKALKELGHEVRIIMPRYRFISEWKFKLHDIIRLKNIPITVGKNTEIANVKSSFIANLKDKVQVYFLDNTKYYGRDGTYQSPTGKKDYKDNDERFIFFSLGVLETLKRLGWQPDIIHCNDWQSGLLPAYLKTRYATDPFFNRVKSVFTIHNMGYQGAFPHESFQKSGLPGEIFSPEGVEAYGKFNFLKAGIFFADSITTVSERYAEEISESDQLGAGLNGLLSSRKKDLHGILNGIDYQVWDPASDRMIYRTYDFKSIEAKADNKKALADRFNLPFNPRTPMIGAISRLVEQKGFDLVLEALPELFKLDLQFVLVASGEKKLEKQFEQVRKKYPDRMGVFFGFDEDLAHLIEAGSDMLLMPSRYEPCGLNQMYSMRYGTIPIVRATGGLEDTVDDHSAGGKGTGFKFEKYDAKELIKTVQRALKVYQQQGQWKKLMRSAMQRDFSWTNSAKKYLNLYKELLKQ